MRMDCAAVCQWILSVVTVVLTVWMESGCGGHEHGHHGSAQHDGEKPTGFHDPKVVQDADHIKEHYEGTMKFNDTDMTPEELEFHYFKLHDFDNNTKLDGLEIYKALTHLLPFEPENEDKYKTTAEHNQGKTKDEIDSIRKNDELKYYTEIVDTVLEEDDLDDDGYLTYPEYVFARKREDARERSEKLREEEEKRKKRN